MNKISYIEKNGEQFRLTPLEIKTKKPIDNIGNERDQTLDAVRHMRYAATLNIPTLKAVPRPRDGKALIVGGGPTLADQLDQIRSLAEDPKNAIFAVNWTHTWLIQRQIIPTCCVLFEIDVEPDNVLKASHEEVLYLICSHCHQKTFDELKHRKRMLWHSVPGSKPEYDAAKELFPDVTILPASIWTFIKSISVALAFGFRSFDLFGCDGSFPDGSSSTHVDGYETSNNVDTDGFCVYAEDGGAGIVKRYNTVGYLTHQVEEFKKFCETNHHLYSMRVHGNSLMRFVHQQTYPDQY
jgi:hypothetical protein